MIKIEQEYVCDPFDDQFIFGNSAILTLTTECKTESAIIESYFSYLLQFIII